MRGARKLATVCIGYAVAIFAAHYLLKLNMLIPSAGICLALGLTGFAFKGNTRKRIVLSLLAACVGFLSYKYYADKFLTPCEELANTKLTVIAVVTAFPEERTSCNLLYVRFEDEALPDTDGLLFDYSKCTSELKPGDIIRAEVKLKSALERYNEKTDINISKGLYIVGTVSGELELMGHVKSDFLYFPKYIGHAVGEKICEIFPLDSAHFMLALLTGDKTDYYGDGRLSTAMSTAGLAHVVAVSGMHVAFLVGFILLVLGRSRRSAIICIALVWVFVVMVGAPPSSIRAAIMQTMLLSAYMFRREFDNITVLSFSLAIILAFNPFACGSISLQLSFAAMSGIMLLTQPIYDLIIAKKPDSRGVAGKIKVYFGGILASSLSATVFTVPLLAVHFGYVSVLSPLANILCLWCISLLFCGGYIICALGVLWSAAGAFLADILSYLVRYIELVVCWISDIPYSTLYVENRLVVTWLCFTYAVLAIYILLRRKRKIGLWLPTAAVAVCFAVMIILTRGEMLADTGTYTVMNVGSGQCICVTAGESTVVIDCGSSGIADNPGTMASSYLHANGRNRIDALVITHLHKDHAGGVVRLINSIEIDTIILPADSNEENGLLEEILAAAEESGASVIYIGNDRRMSFGAIDLELYTAESNAGALMLSADIGGYTMLVTGDAETKAERELVEKAELEGTEVLMVGHHGSKYSSCEELLSEADPDIAVISVGYNSYGHPKEETLDRLNTTDAVILRTDIDGRIVLRKD